MKPDTPILMITLQIPVLMDTTTDQVLDAIGQQVSQALTAIRQQQEEVEDVELETLPDDGFAESVLKETKESYSDQTRTDWLESLGYAA